MFENGFVTPRYWLPPRNRVTVDRLQGGVVDLESCVRGEGKVFWVCFVQPDDRGLSTQ